MLTVEYKLNLIALGKVEALIARGKGVQPGKTLTIFDAKVYALDKGRERLCAVAFETLMLLPDMPDNPDRNRDTSKLKNALKLTHDDPQ